jgi:hypothetical protein
VNDTRLAIIRATSFDRTNTMSSDELAIIHAVAQTLYDLDPAAVHVNPSRQGR